ncbi:MAG: TlpA family protein disulfide reductase [Nitrospirae bacterium]|nr:MAG: TlpA family protein disulfide reductase [Nitrospirota bacterium]
MRRRNNQRPVIGFSGHAGTARWLGLVAGLLVCAFGAAGLSAGETMTDPMAALKISRLGAGSDMPAFSLETLDGRAVASVDLKGKVVLLNFWATWCGPCKDEMPSLEWLRKQFDPADVVVLSVTTDHQREGIRAFMKHLGLALPVLFDEDQEVSGSFMVRGLPTTFLVGKDGRLVGRAVGPRAWDSPEAVALLQGLKEAAR